MMLSKGVVAGLLAAVLLVVGAAFAFKQSEGDGGGNDGLAEAEAPKSEFDDVPKEVMDAIHKYQQACTGPSVDHLTCRLAMVDVNNAISLAEENQPGILQKIEEYQALVERDIDEEMQRQAIAKSQAEQARAAQAMTRDYPRYAYPLGTQCQYKAQVARLFTQYVLESPDTNFSARRDDLRIKLQQDELGGNLTREEAQTSLYIAKHHWGRTPVEAAENAFRYCQEGKL